MRLVARAAALLLLSAATAVLGTSPRKIQWSAKTYGPDGPWYAINIGFGSNTQPIDAFPGGSWQSILYSSQICDAPESGGESNCYARGAGLFNFATSTTAYNATEAGPVLTSADLGDGVVGSGRYVLDTLTLPGDAGESGDPTIQIANLSTIIATEAYRTLPNGTRYTDEVGSIAFGANDVNQTWPNGAVNTNGSLVAGYLWTTNITASQSFGMHIGSVSLGLAPSLYFGGYDESRVLGTAHTLSQGGDALWATITDVSIGVARGRSPFNFTTKAGLLAQGNATLTGEATGSPRGRRDGAGLHLMFDPREPYLGVPQSTCDAIAANLPVTLDKDLGLYLWNTGDPLYPKIVQSPTYLAFTFQGNPNDPKSETDFDIRIPFALLNLTLVPPLATQPTPYFPCRPPADNTNWVLGRAFLQAAFIGVNWTQDKRGPWFLAQAPGPNTAAPVIKEISYEDKAISESPQLWEDSWTGTWREIRPDGTLGGDPRGGFGGEGGSGGGSGLSKGAVAGIAVGGVVVGAFAAGLLFVWYRHQKAKESEAVTQILNYERGVPVYEKVAPAASTRRQSRAELDSGPPPVELLSPIYHNPPIELPAEEIEQAREHGENGPPYP